MTVQGGDAKIDPPALAASSALPRSSSSSSSEEKPLEVSLPVVNYASIMNVLPFNLYHSHLNGLLNLGARRPLNQTDMGHLPDSFEPELCYKKFEASWGLQIKKFPHSILQRSVFLPVLSVVGTGQFVICLFANVIVYLGAFSVPLLSQAIIKSQGLPVSSTSPSKLSNNMLGVFIASCLLIPMLNALIRVQKDNFMDRMTFQMEASLKMAAHRKVLTMATVAQRTHSIGEITNLFSRDIKIACEMLPQLSMLVVPPLQLTVGLILIYQIIGVAALTSLATVFVLTPLQFQFGKLFLRRFRAYQRESAVGMKAKSEVFAGIRGMKYNSWEDPFKNMLRSLRSVELNKLLYYQLFQLPSIACASITPISLPVMAFYTYVRLDDDNVMTYVKAITVLMLYDQIVSALQQIPSTMNALLEAKGALEKIRHFLCAPDLQNHITLLLPAEKKEKVGADVAIFFENATLGWLAPPDEDERRDCHVQDEDEDKDKGKSKSKDYKAIAAANADQDNTMLQFDKQATSGGVANRSVFTLRNMSFKVREGELVAVIGPVGSGKSSLLAAIIGELHLHTSSIVKTEQRHHCSKISIRAGDFVNRRLAYTQQQPWIFNSSVRDNILFGEEYCAVKFKECVNLTCLQPDIDILPNGVDTEIGERGINLSGGQKARVSLARAIYRASSSRAGVGTEGNGHGQENGAADIFLLDDPLSAVDAHTADHLFHQAVLSELVRKRKKTVLLVTHQVHFLPYCDKVLVLGVDGTLLENGTYNEIQERGRVDLAGVVKGGSGPSPSISPVSAINLNGNVDADCVAKSESGKNVKEEDEGKEESSLPSPSCLLASDVVVLPEQAQASTTPVPSPAPASVLPNSLSALVDAKVEVGRAHLLPESPAKDYGANQGDPSLVAASSGGIPTAHVEVVNSSSTVKIDVSSPHTVVSKGTSAGKGGSLISKEGRLRGVVTSEVYAFFIRGGGLFTFSIVVLLICGGEICKALANYVIVDWGKAEITQKTGEAYSGSVVSFIRESGTILSTSQNLRFVFIYTLILCGEVLSTSFVQLGKIVFTQTGAWYFHEALVDCLLRAPVGFYDTSPLGRILNLFSNDMRSMNARLFSIVLMSMTSAISALSGVVMISVATNGAGLVVLLPIGYVYYRLQHYYRCSNTELSRLLSLATTPIIVNFTSTLYSLVSIRAYAAQASDIALMNKKIHTLNSTQRIKNLAKAWLAVRLETVGASITFFCILIQVLSKGFVSPEDMALAVLYAQTLPRLCDNFLRATSFLEAAMSSVERVKHALDTVPRENYDTGRGYGSKTTAAVSLPVIKEVTEVDKGGPVQEQRRGIEMSIFYKSKSKINENKADASGWSGSESVRQSLLQADGDTETVTIIPPPDWPSEGAIEVRNLGLRYSNKSNNPVVLRDISFSVRAKEKIGICGRTGSGKSSLMVALFQIEKCEPDTYIVIDGIDIRCVPLSILRARLGIIMQDSLLFSETLRFNIDPFHDYSDTEIWEVLEFVYMKEAVCHMPGGLDSQIAEGGSNLSHGQKQLICFARAILRKSKVLVLDEATASIDNETDERIQVLLRDRFKDSTILTIAHRLNTIIDSDRVLVMDAGVVSEYDSPQVLLANEQGAFRSLWDQFQEAHK